MSSIVFALSLSLSLSPLILSLSFLLLPFAIEGLFCLASEVQEANVYVHTHKRDRQTERKKSGERERESIMYTVANEIGFMLGKKALLKEAELVTRSIYIYTHGEKLSVY